LSGYSHSKLKEIIELWLHQEPKEQLDYRSFKYIIIDATYFHKDGCLMNLMDAKTQEIIAHIYVRKESFVDAYPWFENLKRRGLDPLFITTDGEQSIIRAVNMIWPLAKTQRCLYHIQREGMRWLRTYPKTQAGKELRDILSKLSWIKSIKERDCFIATYNHWLVKYKDFVKSLPNSTVAFKDLKRTMVLINKALPNMFHYLIDLQVHATTNALEGFHSRLKTDYQRHRGLTKQHRIQYIHWYCYFKNRAY
jgi:transposase-like protein